MPAHCHSLGVIQNPSEMWTSVPVRGLMSPVEGEMLQMTCHGKKSDSHALEGEMPQTSCHKKSNSCPKDCKVLMQSLHALHGFPTTSWRSYFYGSGSNLRSEQ